MEKGPMQTEMAFLIRQVRHHDGRGLRLEIKGPTSGAPGGRLRRKGREARFRRYSGAGPAIYAASR